MCGTDRYLAVGFTAGAGTDMTYRLSRGSSRRVGTSEWDVVVSRHHPCPRAAPRRHCRLPRGDQDGETCVEELHVGEIDDQRRAVGSQVSL